MPHDWDRVLRELPPEAANPLWRRYADSLNHDLLNRWMGDQDFRRILKTDAYDEALGEGVLRLLRWRCRQPVLMDCSEFALQAARGRRHKAQYACADVRCLPFAGGSFDLVFSGSTLDHFQDAADMGRALAEIARVLRPGGRLILTLDNPVNPLVRLRNAVPARWLRRLRLTPYPTGRTLGPGPLRRQLEAVGLVVVRLTAVGHCPRLPAVLLARLVGGRRCADPVLCGLQAFERLESWPGRFLTGHYMAVEAVKG